MHSQPIARKHQLLNYLFAMVALMAASACDRGKEHPGQDFPGAQRVGPPPPEGLPMYAGIACIDPVEVEPQSTPVNIYKGARRCIDEKNYPRAVKLYALAGAYAQYDTLRVSDRSAHQVGVALMMSVFENASEEAKKAFRETLGAMAKNGSPELAGLCAEIRHKGPPAYEPFYMEQHGMNVFLGKDGDPPAKHFDAEEAWDKSVKNYLECAD